METSQCTLRNLDYVPLHSSYRLLDFNFQMKCKSYFNLYFQRGLWTTMIQFFFLFASTSLVQEWLNISNATVATNFLEMSVYAGSWCTVKFLNRLFLTIFLKLCLSLLLVHLFLLQVSLLIQFAGICLHPALCDQWALPAMTFCSSMIIF